MLRLLSLRRLHPTVPVSPGVREGELIPPPCLPPRAPPAGPGPAGGLGATTRGARGPWGAQQRGDGRCRGAGGTPQGPPGQDDAKRGVGGVGATSPLLPACTPTPGTWGGQWQSPPLAAWHGDSGLCPPPTGCGLKGGVTARCVGGDKACERCCRLGHPLTKHLVPPQPPSCLTPPSHPP